MSEVKVYGLCDANCRHQVLTVDQTVDLIQDMAANGFQVPEGYIPETAVNSIVEQNSGDPIQLWVGTQSEWDSWAGDKSKVFAIISDDPTLQSIMSRLNTVDSSIIQLDNNLAKIEENLVNRLNEDIADIEERLSNLGFKEGSITLNTSQFKVSSTYSGDYRGGNKITKQGNYVILSLCVQSIGYVGTGSFTIGQVPSDFIPPKRISLGSVEQFGTASVEASIDTTGKITLTRVPMGTAENTSVKCFINAGYSLVD